MLLLAIIRWTIAIDDPDPMGCPPVDLIVFVGVRRKTHAVTTTFYFVSASRASDN